MKRFLSIALSLSLSLLAPAAALAQGGPPPMQPRPESRGPERGPPPHAARAPEHRETMARHRDWKRGERFEGHRYVLDWRRHHLRQPPRGYQWVHEGDQYLMIAIGSGVIAEVMVPHPR